MSGATSGKLRSIPNHAEVTFTRTNDRGPHSPIGHEFSESSSSAFSHSPFYQRPLVNSPLELRNRTSRSTNLKSPVRRFPIELQREFARRVTAVEALKTAQRASLAELDALFATLQHRAFRGSYEQLRSPEWFRSGIRGSVVSAVSNAGVDSLSSLTTLWMRCARWQQRRAACLCLHRQDGEASRLTVFSRGFGTKFSGPLVSPSARV